VYTNETGNCNSASTPQQLNKTRAVILRSAHLGNPAATAALLERKLETTENQLGVSVFCDLISRPVVHLTTGKKDLF
jgi:hypothetical protein